MFLRTSPSPSILSRGSRYLLRAPGYRHFSLPRSVPLPLPLPLHSLRSLSPVSLRKTSNLSASVSHAYSTIHTTETTTMADASETGVTADSIRGKLIDQLQAQYVEIEDLSGEFSIQCSSILDMYLYRNWTNGTRWLRSSVHGDYRLATICRKEYAGSTSVGQCRPQIRDCGYSCLDAQMLYARAVAVDAAVDWWDSLI